MADIHIASIFSWDAVINDQRNEAIIILTPGEAPSGILSYGGGVLIRRGAFIHHLSESKTLSTKLAHYATITIVEADEGIVRTTNVPHVIHGSV